MFTKKEKRFFRLTYKTTEIEDLKEVRDSLLEKETEIYCDYQRVGKTYIVCFAWFNDNNTDDNIVEYITPECFSYIKKHWDFIVAYSKYDFVKEMRTWDDYEYYMNLKDDEF